ncbi:MAG: hypothetical protein AAFO07_25310 [Bacteroidota bacterium]
MSFLKLKGKFDWKYILGEIALIFIGINLAIWFNNYNAAQKTNQAKTLAIQKIAEEIEQNTQGLDSARINNKGIVEAFYAVSDLRHPSDPDMLFTTPVMLRQFQKDHPDFFHVNDSIIINKDSVEYIGGFSVNFEITQLSDIAWQTARSIDILHELNYDCLLNLGSLYDLQNRVVKVTDQTVDKLQGDDWEGMLKMLEFLDQLEMYLLENYKQIKENLKECK